MREMLLVLAADLLQKYTCGLEHGQPAQRTMSKGIFDGFPWVFHPSWSQSSQDGVPIVQLMFLYEARARLVQEHHQHNWDPISGHLQLN